MPTYQMMSLSNGKQGTKETLAYMAKLVKDYKSSPAIFELSRRLVAALPQKNFFKEAEVIHNFVQKNIRYTRDIDGIETVQSPIQTLRLKTGDCDDKSVLVGALLASIGHKVRFVASGPRQGIFVHVHPETRIGQKWLVSETTEPWKFGEVKYRFPCRYEFHIK